MTRFPVSSEKEASLLRRLATLGVREEDLVERFVRAAGPGGQNVNKTSTAVQLRHAPSGIEVKAQSARSQGLNRYLARQRLAEELEARRQGEASARALSTDHCPPRFTSPFAVGQAALPKTAGAPPSSTLVQVKR